MKKKLSATLLCLCLCLLTGCSSGVSQEEYDSVTAQRDELQAQVESLQAEVANLQAELGETANTAADGAASDSSRAAEFSALVSEVQTSFEEEYKFCSFSLQMIETYLSWDMAKEWTNLHDDYDIMTMNLTKFQEYLNDEDALNAMSDQEYEKLVESVKNQYTYWQNMSYHDISNVIDYLLEDTSAEGQ